MSRAELWRRAQAVFLEAVERSESERPAVVRELCAGDPQLEKAVRDLLEADAKERKVPQAPPVGELVEMLSERQAQYWVGRSLGAYRIVEPIGRGGMGSVFLAERADAEYTKQVAIKLLGSAIASDDQLLRFRRERQVLAELEHPHIARLIDGGSSERGEPYIVMELVNGLPVTDYCDREGLSIGRRLELFALICHAVQYAHQNLVVHRDLKASNILVRDDGQPKLLDFGIAKLVEPQSEGETVGGATAPLTRILTLDYASPEQVAGRPITTASDIYSLGVLLYELLTGRRPREFGGHSLTEVVEMIEHQEPPRPSGAWRGDGSSEELRRVSGKRGLEPRQLAHRLAGDLDNIVLKALRRDPSERYVSANQLAEDLERFRAGLPVRARAPSLGYRAAKFVARHRLAVIAGAAGLALLVTFLAVAVAQRDRALREQRRAEEVTRFLLDAFAEVDPERARGRTVTAREVLDASARRVRRELGGESELEATLGLTLGEVYSSLGLHDSARPLLERAVELRSVAGSPAEGEAAALHAWAHLLYLDGDVSSAVEPAERALELRRRSSDAAAAETLHLLAQIRWRLDERDEAIEIHRRALSWTADTAGTADPAYVDGLRLLGKALRSKTLYQEADAVFNEALAIQRRTLPGDHPMHASLLGELASTWEAREKPDEARPLALAALDMSRRVYGETHPAIAGHLNSLGNIEALAGNSDLATEHYLAAIEMSRLLLGPDHPDLAGMLYNQAALLHRNLGRPASAEPLYRAAVETTRRNFGPDHINLGFFLVGLGDALVDTERAAEAIEPLESALAIFAATDSRRNQALAQSALGAALLELGQVERAAPLITDSHPVLEEHFGTGHRISERSGRRMTRLRELTGRSAAGDTAPGG